MLPQKLTQYSEKTRVVMHLHSLGADDRRLRFGSVVDDNFITRYVDDYWNKQGAWFGTFDGSVIVAVVHVAINGDEAELGLSVDPQYRGKKLGQKLFERAAFYIKSKNIKHVFMHCLSENAAMRHLAHKYGMTLVTQYGETDARAAIDFPYNPLDPINEAVAQQLALYDNSIRAISKLWSSYIERIWDSLPKTQLKKVSNG